MAYSALRLIKAPEKPGQKEKIKTAILTAYAGGNLPVFFNKYIRKEPVLVDGSIATMVHASLPSKLTRRERAALNVMVRSVVAGEKLANSQPWHERCTIDKAVKTMVKTGEWRGMELENYLNAEGAQNLARDFYERREYLARNRNYRGGVVSPSRTRDKLLKALKTARIDAPINYVHLPWRIYFAIKDIYLSSPEKFDGSGGLDRLEKKLQKKGMKIYRRHLESGRSVIKQTTQLQPV